MKIIEINIIQFGKFSNRTFTLEDGLNIIKGDNESGKSTLLAFIKFALYGVGRKNPSVSVGERERAISWNTGTAAGSLTVEDESGKKYRIERIGREGARGAYTDKVKIIDIHNGEEVFGGEIPGEHFLGIGAQAYDSICNIRQLECVNISGEAVKGVIDNLLSGGDDSTDVQSALKALDTERRRLLHTNGKGGLVFDCELSLERLKSEHRGAVVFENEYIKNNDELARVEIALAKSRDEHELAQKMCDLHDDVIRLQKFDELRTLKSETEKLKERAKELDNKANFDVALASYDSITELKSASSSLSRSKLEFSNAQKELSEASDALEAISFTGNDTLSELMDEFGSPRSALSYLSAKLKKKSNSVFILTAFGTGGAILLIFAAILAFIQNNTAGSMTVAFIGAALCAVAAVFFKQFNSAKAEILSFMTRLGKEFAPNDVKSISEYLENFIKSKNAKLQYSTAFERAKFNLSIAEDKLSSDVDTSRKLLISLGDTFACGNETEAINSLCERIKAYLESKSELDDSIRENNALIRSISAELERFSEQAIRSRITPEIEEKVRTTSYERLKSERDLALHRTNQYSQYKAGIERSLASYSSRRTSSEIFPEIEAEEERLEALRLRLEAVKLAAEAITSASLRLKSDITPRIRERAQENLSLITGGKYSELFIDNDMGLSIFAEGATRPIDSLSKGSLDAAYFAVRLALIKTLMSEKEPPLFMDEPLSQLDDGRAENLLRAISDHAQNSQCILFTCQNRDVKIASNVTKVNVIELNN